MILLTVTARHQGTFVPCEVGILWSSADRTSSRQLRDTTRRSRRADRYRVNVYEGLFDEMERSFTLNNIVAMNMEFDFYHRSSLHP